MTQTHPPEGDYTRRPVKSPLSPFWVVEARRLRAARGTMWGRR